MKFLIRLGLIFSFFAPAGFAEAANLRIAVAANFLGTAEKVVAAFTAATGTKIDLSAGSTGTLYAQISQGAPFDLLLSADLARPQKAIDEGLAVEGSLRTYALGKLALYSAVLDLTEGEAVLKRGAFQHLSIANPINAPYGKAAMETLKALGLTGQLAGKIVTGENVTQTLQFIATGNAELGFVALSQIKDASPSHLWLVPSELYTPIAQGAVVLKAAADIATAWNFLDFLVGPEGQKIIEEAGYGLP